MTLSCVVIDDDAAAVDLLQKYIAEMPVLNLIKTYTDPIIALNELSLHAQPIDIVITDVEMPKMNGIDLAKSLAQKIKKLILVSAHLQHSITGYDIAAENFLHKPVSFEKFKNAITLAIEHIRQNSADFIQVLCNPNKQICDIDIHDIILIRGASNYIRIITEANEYTVYSRMKDIEERLSFWPDFIRAGKSYILSKRQIVRVKGNKVFLKKNLTAQVGRQYRDAFNEFIRLDLSAPVLNFQE